MAYNHYILTCGGTACESNKGTELFAQLNAEAEKQGVKGEVQIVKTGCFGFCEKGPIVKVLPEESFYVDVKPEDAKEIIAEQIVKGREVKRLLYNDEGAEKKSVVTVEYIRFYQKQFRVVLRNCGVIDPESIDEYVAREGYSGMGKVLFQWSPEQIIEEMSKPVEDGYYTASMNVDWVFATWDSPTNNAFVENDTYNTRTVYFDLFDDESGELVYSSPYIPVGEKLEKFALEKELSAGSHMATVTYHLVDDDHNELSTVSVAVTLRILE
jgi:(2Fe-2S) ferredoxin